MLKILDIKINPITKEEFLKKLDIFIESKKVHLVCTVNTEFIMTAQNDFDFKDILNNKSSINITDGIGVMWASKFLSYKTFKTPVLGKVITFLQWIFSGFLVPFYPKHFQSIIPERISGADLIWDVARLAQEKDKKIFLLGGAPTVAERTALVLQTEIYGLKVSGIHSGNPATDTDEMIDAINKSKADILLVAFGAPKQEKWITKNAKKTGVKLCIGLGGTFDFIAGERKRAPKFIQKIGFEWLYRLIQEPSRIRRQFSIFKFIFSVLRVKLNKS